METRPSRGILDSLSNLLDRPDMEASFLIFVLTSEATGNSIPEGESLLYSIDFDQTLDELRDGDKGEVGCETGTTPAAPSVMSLMPDGTFLVKDGSLSIRTVEYNLSAPLDDLLDGEAEGAFRHKAFGNLKVQVLHEVDEVEFE